MKLDQLIKSLTHNLRGRKVAKVEYKDGNKIIIYVEPIMKYRPFPGQEDKS